MPTPRFLRLPWSSGPRGEVNTLHNPDAHREAVCLDGREVSDRTRQLIYTVISSALTWAVRELGLNQNVAQVVQTPSADSDDVQPLDDDELAAFLPVAAEHRLWALWVLYLSLGLRRCEGLGLAWEDIDFKNSVVHVRYQLKRVRGKGLQRVRLKSKKSRRVLPLPEVAARALLAWQRAQQSEERSAGERWGGNTLSLVFTTRYGKPIEPSTINRTLLVLAKRCGLRELHPHALRHSCATFLKAMGVDVIVIRALSAQRDCRHLHPRSRSGAAGSDQAHGPSHGR